MEKINQIELYFTGKYRGYIIEDVNVQSGDFELNYFMENQTNQLYKDTTNFISNK